MVSNFKQTFFILLLLLSTFFTVSGYTVYSGCPDLTNLSASYVEAYTGRTWEPMQNKGVVEGRHTVITTQGTDPYTDNKLKFIPDGATKVVRLGNDLAEAETDVLIYHFRVDANNPILKLRYAVVMENPGHAKSEQPHFNLQVLDASGKLVNSLLEVHDDFDSWDGTYNGHPMPSTDYWYVVYLREIDTEYTGHFTLIR